MESAEESSSKMECRLCLEALTEAKWSIIQPDLKEQLSQVFRFTIDFQPDLSSDICRECLTTVDEFYQYSERVRYNQDTLAVRLELSSSQNQAIVAQNHAIKFEATDEPEVKKGSDDEEDGDEYNDDIVGNDWTDDVFVEPFVALEVKQEPQAKRSTRSRRKLAEENSNLERVKEKKEKRTTARKSPGELKVEKEEDEPIECTKEKIPPGSSTDEDDPMEDEDDYQPEQKKPKKQRRSTVRRGKTKLKENAEDDEQHDSKKRTKKSKQSSRDEWHEDDKRIEEFYEMVCDLCGDKFQNLLSMRKHFRREHGKAAYIKCCNKKLMRRGTMVDHILIHVNPETYRCEPCDKTFRGKRYLQEHLENVHGSIEERPFKCDQCDRYFAKESLLRTHISNHRKVRCSQCNMEFPNSRFLNEHLKKVHDNAHLTRVCDRCGKSFSGPSARSGLKQHIDGVHMGLGDKTKRQCPVCQKWLLGKRCLTVHLQLHSEIGQPHVCNICNQNYPHSRALTRHKRFVHGEQKYECEFCGKKFRKSVALKEHRATHTGEALYTCKICGSTTNSNASYYSHMKKQHPVEWAEQKLKAEEANKPTTTEPAIELTIEQTIEPTIEPPTV